MKPAKHLFFLLLAMQSCALQAQDSRFVEKNRLQSGWSDVQLPLGGEFEYGRSKADGRPKEVFMVGMPKRTLFVYLSAQEQKALWEMRQREIEKTQAQESVVVKKLVRHKSVVIEWPKVIVKGDQTCVPEIHFSDSPDWKEHLVCWNHWKKGIDNE